MRLLQKILFLVLEEEQQETTGQHRIIWKMQSKIKSFARLVAHRAMLISVSLALSQTPAYAEKPPTASVSCGVPVYATAFAGTNLYCLVTETHGSEQLA